MIGIIGAMDKEIAKLLKEIHVEKEVEYAGKTFYQGSLYHSEVVLVQSGIGKVNAAIATTLLLNNFNIDFVINIGVAGGLLPAQVGDIILAKKIGYFDVDLTSIDNVPFGKMSNDPHFIEIDLSLHTLSKHMFDRLGLKYQIGNIVSGDQFVTNPDIVTPIKQELENILACEMEGMAIAMTCHKFSVPFLSIRGISDVIDDDNQNEVYATNVDDICNLTAGFVLKFIEEL